MWQLGNGDGTIRPDATFFSAEVRELAEVLCLRPNFRGQDGMHRRAPVDPDPATSVGVGDSLFTDGYQRVSKNDNEVDRSRPNFKQRARSLVRIHHRGSDVRIPGNFPISQSMQEIGYSVQPTSTAARRSPRILPTTCLAHSCWSVEHLYGRFIPCQLDAGRTVDSEEVP